MYAKFSLPLNQKLMVGGLTSLGLLLLCAPAMAHHPFGEEAPANALEGFLSGLGHPVIGLDHLAFVVAAGLLAAILNRGWLIPVAFVITSMLGTGVHLINIDLPAPELFIAVSVLGFGVLLARKNSLPAGVVIALAAVAGLFHGYAYGEAVVGAEMSALVAYLVGFATIQMAIALGVYFTVRRLGVSDGAKALPLRFAGFTLAGIGAAFLSSVMLG
jgi:urease accessory protein